MLSSTGREADRQTACVISPKLSADKDRQNTILKLALSAFYSLATCSLLRATLHNIDNADTTVQSDITIVWQARMHIRVYRDADRFCVSQFDNPPRMLERSTENGLRLTARWYLDTCRIHASYMWNLDNNPTL